jgi:hypothetical protein
MIDGYLAGRYQLPLTEVPPLVVDLAQVIAIYKLHPFEPDPKISNDYNQALKTLRDIARAWCDCRPPGSSRRRSTAAASDQRSRAALHRRESEGLHMIRLDDVRERIEDRFRISPAASAIPAPSRTWSSATSCRR